MLSHPSQELCHEIHVADNVLQDFAGLDCSICNRHFGFQYRIDLNYIFCSPQCLSVGKHNLEQFNSDAPSHGQSRGVNDRNNVLGLIRGRNNFGGNRGGRHGGNLLRSLRQEQNVLQYYEASRAMITDSHHRVLSPTAVIKEEPEQEEETLEADQATSSSSSSSVAQSLSNGFSIIVKAEDRIKSENDVEIPSTSSQSSAIKVDKEPLPKKETIVSSQQEQQPESTQAEKVRTPSPPILNDVHEEPNEIQSPAAEPLAPITNSNSSETETDQGPKPSSDDESASSSVTFCVRRGGHDESGCFTVRRVPRPEPVAPLVVPEPVEPLVVPAAPASASEVHQTQREIVAEPVHLQNPDVRDHIAPSPVKVVKKVWTVNDMPVSKSLENSAPCNVVFAWGNQKFHLNASQDEEKMASLQQAIQEYCKNAPGLDRIPSVSDIVFASYDETEFYRAKVSSVDEASGTVHLLFIDYGDEKNVNWKECRQPKDEIMKEHPIYGIVFELSLERPMPQYLQNEDIPQEIVAGMETEIQTIIEKKQSTTEWMGKICMSNSTRTFNDVINELIKKTSPKWTIRNVKFSENFRTGVPVYISYTWELERLNLVASADGVNLDRLEKDILNSVSGAPGLTRTPQVDDIVIAPYENTYYRGRVTGVEGTDICVAFIDHGDEVKVKIYECKEPTDEIMKHPVYGICMKMAGVPSGTPWIETNLALAEAMERIAIVDVKSRADPTLWIGQLRFGDDKTWSDLVNDAIKSQ